MKGVVYVLDQRMLRQRNIMPHFSASNALHTTASIMHSRSLTLPPSLHHNTWQAPTQALPQCQRIVPSSTLLLLLLPSLLPSLPPTYLTNTSKIPRKKQMMPGARSRFVNSLTVRCMPMIKTSPARKRKSPVIGRGWEGGEEGGRKAR